jgi:hypothetical protein
MDRFWFVRLGSKRGCRRAFTPVNWKGCLALYGFPIFFGTMTAKLTFSFLPASTIPPGGPSPVFVAISTAVSLALWYLIAWVLFRHKIDWTRTWEDYHNRTESSKERSHGD